MAERNCGECGRYRQNDCRPDVCQPGDAFKLFLDPVTNPKTYCRCGKRLCRARSEKWSPEYREIFLICPAHGTVGKIKEQYIQVKKVA